MPNDSAHTSFMRIEIFQRSFRFFTAAMVVIISSFFLATPTSSHERVVVLILGVIQLWIYLGGLCPEDRPEEISSPSAKFKKFSGTSI